MVGISHEPLRQERPSWSELLRIRELWASIAIAAMWLAVVVDSVWGPSLVSASNDGNSTTVPSAIIVALFAWLATSVVARYAFKQD